MRSVAPVAGLLLCACASSTGILPAGPDTYTLTERLAPIRGGGDAAEANALSKAINFALIKAVNLLQP
jgi:cobalamin biosynthesis protein CobD/CbiB